ncbi:SH3 domain-containing protein, partial [Pelagibacteraceae bacterium]|nr:SH3 domain-containing protein [Pelagibacteraceae bacterium]
KKFLPVLILDSSDNFMKIRDHENNTGWIHISQLSKKKAAIVIDDELIVFNKPSVYSTPTVILKKGRLSNIIKCTEDWCKIKIDEYKGWVKKTSLWGLF